MPVWLLFSQIKNLIPAFAGMALLFLWAFAPPAFAAQSSLAMVGEPKYKDGFTHFDYANPDAPKGGTLKLAASGTYDSLNPFIIRGNPALGLNTGYLSLVYEPLMARSADEPFSLYGLIAQSVDVPDDRSSVTFHLNPAARFSDGTPITADDVIYSFETLRDKGRPNHRTYYKKVTKYEKRDDHTVFFAFKPNEQGTIDREMPLIMALMPILPKHDWEGREFNQTSLHIPIGSGPYRIAKIEPGRSIVYARNPDYWGRVLPVEKGLHNFDTIRIDYYRDDGVSLQAFKAGQYDWRRENDPNRWAESYDFPAAHDGRVTREELPHHRTEPASGFIFNTRRDPFHDPVLREALAYAFDSGWIDRNLYHGHYHRITSYFPNSELAAPDLPDDREKALLEKYRGQLPSEIFTQSQTPPSTDGSEESLRANLLKAATMLRNAGYVLKEGQLMSPSGKPVAFEILLSDPAEEKIALNWTRMLKRLGVMAHVHTVDSAQYQARLAAFDYDVTSGKWINSLSPGNEQMYFWGSAAADTHGSRNYAGVKSPVVDALASAIPEAHTREDLVTAAHALDRVLLSGHYWVPFFYLGADDLAYWNKLHHPAAAPPYGVVIESWWSDR
jgi:microcin C transport system substrate-binding protein